jgi:hypothetical protein
MKITPFIVLGLLTLCGCKAPNSIVTTAQSVLGISVSENPATQLYEARAGIVVSQVAFVPCNTNSGYVPDVILEFRVNNLFTGGLVYQRLAIGSSAVGQPGAALMFARDAKGVLNTNAVEGIIQRLQAVKPK